MITSPPEIIGLADVYLLEGSSSTLGFEIDDSGDSQVSVEITEGPDYVSLSFDQDANTGYDMQVAGPKVKAPTLLIYGAGDLRRFDGERAHEGIKGSSLKVFSESPGGAHDAMPEEFTNTALDFLLEGTSKPSS